MAPDSEHTFEYNDELLLNEEDVALARQSFPNLFFALHHPELNTAFENHNGQAMVAKARSRRWGFIAVALATTSLLIAMCEPLLHSDLPEAGLWRSLPTLLAGIAGVFGVCALAIGFFGVLFRKSKEQWLHDRLITERVRQWHAQSLVGQIPAILRAAKSTEGRRAFAEARSIQFEEFRRRVINRVVAELPMYLGGVSAASTRRQRTLVWLRTEWAMPPDQEELDPEDPLLSELFEAYEATRLRGQLQYTSYKLRRESERFSTHAGIQAHVLDHLAFACVVGLLALHALVVVGILTGVDWMNGDLVHAAILGVAIAALAGRTLEEGLQPSRELRRLETYLTALESARERFHESQLPADKIAAMRDIEETAFEEMLEFLKTSKESKFVM